MTSPSGSSGDNNSDPNNDGGNTSSTNTGNLPGDIANTLGQAVSGLGSSIASPFTNWFGQLEADTANFFNQSFNTIFYGLIALTGAGISVWGLYLLFKDTAGGKLLAGVGETAGALIAGPEAAAAVGASKIASAKSAKKEPRHDNEHYRRIGEAVENSRKRGYDQGKAESGS